MRLPLGAVVVLLALAATGCGSGGSVGSPTTPAPAPSITLPGGPSPTGSTASGSELTILVEDGTGTTTTWTLTCDPVGGTHPAPEQACAALQRGGEALNPVPPDKMCAQVYSGPERATITGTWQGRQVSATLSRVNSCETARWDTLVPLVPSGGR